MSLFDELGLGEEYSQGKKSNGLGQFTSKPSPRPYQPFGGQLQNQKPTLYDTSFDPYQGQVDQSAQQYKSPFEDDLDIYDELRTQRDYFSKEYSALNQSAKLYESRYDDFVKNKLKPFYETEVGGIEDFETDDEFINAIDADYNYNLKKSKEADGLFGADESVQLARKNLEKYIKWNQPNGLKDQFLRLQKDRNDRRSRADEFKAREVQIIDKLTSIPLDERRQLDEDSKLRKKSNISQKAFNNLLDSQSWQTPIRDWEGNVQNLERTDPRVSSGFSKQSKQAQSRRLQTAQKGEIASILQRRDYTKKERSLRDRGIIASRDGMMDGYPIGLSRKDVDVLDLDKMRKAGMTEYRGRPLEEALNELGGEDQLRISKIMNAVYTAKNNYEDAASAFFRDAGSVKSVKLKEELEKAKQSQFTALKLAFEFGLDNELFEQAETTSWLSGIANAAKRGMLMSEMSNYTPDFLTNSLDADEIENFIEVASQMEDLPTSRAMARYKKTKSDDFLGAIGKLLFNNTDAIPELFVESMMSFIPSTFKAALATVPAGAAAGSLKGLVGGPKGALAGGLTGAGLGARAAWGVASFTLELAGEVQAAMTELDIDWKNPKMFAAAWNNDITRNAIIKKASKKAGVIGAFDLLSAGMAGKMAALKELGLNGGKLIDGASWAKNIDYANRRAPRFTNFQKGSNIGLEIGADSALGTAGEFFGQAWSKEAGEAWDWDAIAAEGVIGVGPGFFGAFMQDLKQSSDDFSTAPIEYSDISVGPEGERGTINRAGFVREYQTFSSAQGMTSAILEQAGIDESNMNDIENGRKVAAVYDWIGRMWMADKDKMQNLRVVFTDRTPLPKEGYEGSFETDDMGNGVMYISSEDMQRDPVGVFFHEAAHMARYTMFTDQEIIDLYEGLGSDEKMQAFTEYYKKVPGRKLQQYSEAEQKEIQAAYKKFTKGGVKRMADEWFSYQFVRLLAGGTPDKSVKSDMQAWLKKFAYPFLKEFAGSEQAAGNQKDVLNARILSYMQRSPRGFIGPFNPKTQMADTGDTFTDFNAAGIQAPEGVNVLSALNDSEGLNFLIGRVMSGYVTAEERKQVAEDFNTFMGKPILPTDLTFWSQRQAEQLADAEQTLDKQRKAEKSDEEAKELNEKTLGEFVDQEVTQARRLNELLARGRVEEITEEQLQSVDPDEKISSGVTSRKRDAEELKQGNRFRVILAQPGRNQLGTKVKYFKSRAEANEAVKKFEQKNNIDRIKKIKGRHTKMVNLLTSDQKFKKAVADSKKALKEKNKDSEPSIHAIVAHMFDLQGLMRDSLFGSNYIDSNLAEDSQSQKKPPSMREIHEAIWNTNKDLEEAFDLLEAQEASLVNEIYELRRADAELKKLEAEDKKKKAAEKKKEAPKQEEKKEKPKATFGKSSVVQVRKDGLYMLKDGKPKKIQGSKKLYRIKKYLRKSNDFKDIPAEKAADLKKLVEFYKTKTPKKYHSQIMIWARKGEAKTQAAPKPATRVSRKIESGRRGLVNIADEIKDAERALTNVREFKDTLMPEQAAVMWADTKHPYYFIPDTKISVTLGQLAASRKTMQVFNKNSGRVETLSNPQQTLLQFARDFDAKKVGDGTVKLSGLKTKAEYAMHMDAVLASVMNRSDFMNKPGGYMKIGSVRTAEDSSNKEDVELAQDNNFGGFQAEKGTNYFLLASYRLARNIKEEGNKIFKANLNKEKKDPIPEIRLTSADPSLEEHAMYEVANGKAYEDRGGAYENKAMYRYFAIVNRRIQYAVEQIQEIDKKLKATPAGQFDDTRKVNTKGRQRDLLIKRKEFLESQIRGMVLEPDDIANYAEEDQYFPKIIPGSTSGKKGYAYSFSEYLYLDQVEQAINDYLDYDFYEIPGRTKPFGLEGTDREGLTNPQNIEKSPKLKYNEKTGERESYSNMMEWVAATKKKFGELKLASHKEVQRKGKRVKPLFFDFPALDLSPQPDEIEPNYEAGPEGPSMPSSMVDGEKQTYQKIGYNYREPGEEANDQIPERTDVHGGFKRMAVDEPINLIQMFRDIVGAEGDAEPTLTPGRFDSTKLVDFVEPEDGTIIEFEYADDTKTAPSKAAKKIKAIWKVNKEFGDAAWHYTDAANKKIQVEIEAVGGGKVKTKLGQALEDAWMSEVDKRLRSGQQDLNSITLAELAEWIYRNDSDINHLGNLPSMKVSGKKASEMSGAPGGGLLMFVYESFLKKAYDLLNIKDFEFETEATEAVSLQDYQESVTYKNAPAKIIIDENGGWGLYRVDSLGSVRIPKVPKKEFEKLLLEKRGRTLKEVVKLLKEQSKVAAGDVTVDAEGKTEVFKDLKVKYRAKKFFVTSKNEDGSVSSKLEPRSIFAESELVPSHDYIRKTLAPIMQAVIDARRIDLNNDSKAGEDKVFASDTQRREDDRSGRDDVPEGVFDNTEQETDTSKDQAKTADSDLEKDISQPDIDEDKDLTESTMAEADEITKQLTGTDTLKNLFLIKNRLKDKFTVYDVAREMQNDPRLWKAFDLPRPPKSKYFKNLAGKKPDALYQYVEKLKKQKNWPLFEKRILQGGTETLGSGYVLSSSIPEGFGKLGSVSTLVAKMGNKMFSEEDKKKYLRMLKNFDAKTSIVDQADPAKEIATRFLETTGLADQNLREQLDIHGLWHLYFGKGKDLVEKAQNNYIQPIKDALLKHNVDFETFGEYLLARAAPSRNMHLKKVWTDYAETLSGSKKEGVLKFIEERKDNLSGISTKDAEKVVAELESQSNIQNFLADPDNPLQLFYDMNKEALQMKRESGLIMSDKNTDEYAAMVTAMSQYSWKGKSKAKLKDDYSYAPMQGFEGETESLYDAEESYERVGKKAGGTGKGFDQPKHMLLQKGAFGRVGTKDKNGKSTVVGPDPKTVFAVAQEQYFDSSTRSSKAQVSNSLGQLYGYMKAIAYPKEKDNVELPKELKNLDADTKAAVKAEFDRYFEKEFTSSEIKAAYEFKELDYEIDGSKATGLRMVRKELNKQMQNDPLVFVYRTAGVPQFIKFKSNESGARLAASMKNLNHQGLPFILEWIGKVTKILAQSFTSLNPAFLIPNFIKDLGTAAIHLSEDDKKALIKDALLTPSNLKNAFKAVYKESRSKTKGERIKDDTKVDKPEDIVASGDWARIYRLYRASGGQVSYFRHPPLTELIEDLQKMKSPKNRNFVLKLKDWVDDSNTAIENTIRVSTFAAAVKNGRSAQEAAKIARNVTVDFNQKGNLTQAFGSLYVFFGANVNSAHRLVTTLKRRGKKGALGLVSGLIGLGALVSMMNRLLDDDDDEAVPDIDTISTYVRDTNITIPLPGNFGDPTKGDTGYLKIPIPLGYNMFYAMGASAMDFLFGLGGRGGIGMFDFLTRNTSNLFNAFNPIGGASIQAAVTPTGAQPIIEAIMNENFMGSEIRKTTGRYENPKPGHMEESPRTQEFWKDFSKWVNKQGGGSDVVQGSLKGIFTDAPLNSSDDVKWNISGSQLEHIFLGYTGGPGAILNMIFGSGIYPAFDDSEYDLQINKLPVINRFIRNSTYGTTTRRMYYQLRETVNIARADLKRADNVSPAVAAEVKRKYGNFINMHPQIKQMDGFKKKIRNQKDKIESSTTLSSSQKRQRIEELDRKELSMLTKIIKKAQKLDLV